MDASKRVAGTLAIPLIFAIVLFSVCAANGRGLLNTSTQFTYFLINAAIIMLTTFALSINLGSGRFDFSLGSMATLSAIIASKITYAMLGGGAGSAIVMLLLCIVVGAVLGAFSGALYALLRIPPIIVSLGVTLIYEGICFALTSGAFISTEIQNPSMTLVRTGWYIPFIIILVALALIYFIFDRTKFGYDYKALREGQRVSVNTGIREVPNAVVCYIICGALMGVVGFLMCARDTTLTADVLNFGSISVMFSAFLPMFIGGFIGRYSNDKLGYLIAALCMALLSSTFAVFSGVVNSSTRSIVEAVLLVAFLIFLNNEKLIRSLVTLKPLREFIQKKKGKTEA